VCNDIFCVICDSYFMSLVIWLNRCVPHLKATQEVTEGYLGISLCVMLFILHIVNYIVSECICVVLFFECLCVIYCNLSICVLYSYLSVCVYMCVI